MPTTKIVLYKQKTLADGTHPIMLQLTNNRKSFRISLGYKCTNEEWDFEKGKFKRTFYGYKNKNRVLKQMETKAEDVLDKIKLSGKPFTPQSFREEFTGVNKSITVFEFFEELFDDFDKKGKAGNKIVYKDTRNALKRFWKSNKTLMFADIDYKFLKKWEAFLIDGGCSGGGAAVYMRTLRATINEAIRRGYIEKEFYPFSTVQNKNGYSINHLKSKASPRALSIEDMDKLKNFPTENYPQLKQSLNYFLFSYFARGMNFKDMAMLKWSNIYNGRINYTREKTNKFLTIKISDNMQHILNKYPKEENNYIFPILSDFHKTPEQIKNRVKKCLKKYNVDLKEMASINGIQSKITSYVARHTFATTLKYKNTNIALISESLGHNNIATTSAYLKKFDNTELDNLEELL